MHGSGIFGHSRAFGGGRKGLRVEQCWRVGEADQRLYQSYTCAAPALHRSHTSHDTRYCHKYLIYKRLGRKKHRQYGKSGRMRRRWTGTAFGPPWLMVGRRLGSQSCIQTSGGFVERKIRGGASLGRWRKMGSSQGWAGGEGEGGVGVLSAAAEPAVIVPPPGEVEVGVPAAVPILLGCDVNADLIALKVYVRPEECTGTQCHYEQQTPCCSAPLERQDISRDG